MIIIYYLGAELITVSLGVGLSIKAISDSVINVFDHGYKYDKEKVYKENDKERKVNKFKNLLDNACLFIPGVNLIKPVMSLYKANSAYKDNEMLIPMTDCEKEEYSKLTCKREKIAFSVVLTSIGEYRESDEKRSLRKKEEEKHYVEVDYNVQKEESEIERLRRLKHELNMQINDSKNMCNDIEEMYEFANKQKVYSKIK